MLELSTIVKLELIQLWRDSTVKVLAALLAILTIYTILSSSYSYEHANEGHRELKDTARNKMLHQKPTSAHMAGHYGHIAFKPATFLQAIDPGVTTFTGTTVRIEAHRQNEDVFAPAAGQSSLVRFGDLSFSMLLQLVVPLLILFTCYRSVVNDRLNGTLKLLLSQGISLRKLLAGKIAAYALVFGTYLLMAAFAYAIAFSLEKSSAEGGVFLRIIGLLALYAVYYLMLISTCVFFSAKSREPSSLLASLLASWFVLTIILPKAAASIGEQAAPLPTRMEVSEGIRAKKKLGINGHDKKNVYTIAFVDSVLKVYGADSVQQLPIKIGGLLMQADEDFNNALYDQALGELDSTVARQNRVGALTAFADPFMAVKNLSMGIAGTDMYHHFDFTKRVEDYRRVLIRNLNAQDALRESAFKDEKGKLTADYWQQTNDFSYTAPGLSWSLRHYYIELFALFCWVVLILSILYFLTNKISVS